MSRLNKFEYNSQVTQLDCGIIGSINLNTAIIFQKQEKQMNGASPEHGATKNRKKKQEIKRKKSARVSNMFCSEFHFRIKSDSLDLNKYKDEYH